MNPAVATVIGALVGGGVAMVVAIINTVAGRGGRRADIADKVTEAWERTSERLDKDLAKIEAKCEKCEMRLAATQRTLEQIETDSRRTKAALRALIRVLDSDDQAALREAIDAARALT